MRWNTKEHLIYRVDTPGNTDTVAQNDARYEERQSICFDEKMRNKVNSHEGWKREAQQSPSTTTAGARLTGRAG